MKMLTPVRFFPYALGNCIQKLHNIEGWLYDEENDMVVFNKQKTFCTFERANSIMTLKRS